MTWLQATNPRNRITLLDRPYGYGAVTRRIGQRRGRTVCCGKGPNNRKKKFFIQSRVALGLLVGKLLNSAAEARVISSSDQIQS